MKIKYWEPELCDDDYFSRLRLDYPENSDMSNDELHDHFNNSRKYSITWDHIGDAYAEYEPLSDAYLRHKSAMTKVLNRLESGNCDEWTLIALKQILKEALED